MPAADAPSEGALVRRALLQSTQRLLGDTISISDADWSAPALLPGWTRAHVATHVARHADALRRAVVAAAEGTEVTLEAGDAMRDLEAGARRSPLDLQIDLDTSAGRLEDTLASMTPEQGEIELAEGFRIADAATARLNEVILHHVDLDCGFGFADVPAGVARWLLEWNLHRSTDIGLDVAVAVRSTSELARVLGTGDIATIVTGTDATLLGWVTGRLPGDAVAGAEGLAPTRLR